MNKKTFHRISVLSLATMMTLSTVSTSLVGLHANTLNNYDISTYDVDASGYNVLGSVIAVNKDGNKVDLTINTGEKIRFTFLDQNVFRMYMAPEGEDFREYPAPNSSDHTATITNKTDAQYENEYNVAPTLDEDDTKITISTSKIKIEINKAQTLVKLMKADGTVVWEEAAPLKYKTGSTIQTLKTDKDEYFYGGGTQNGRFSHKGKSIKIQNTNNWVDKGVASPNPFYWSTDGYGVVRNTWKPGEYDFGSKDSNIVQTTHNEKRFDAYYFVDDTPSDILGDYYELTGSPAELPEYASYLGHLNCYNRDFWKEVPEGTNGAVKLGDKWYQESQSDNGGNKETLLGEAETTAQQIIEDHKNNDMPLGWFLPNDGYGCGYGQSDSQAGDIENLKDFADYAIANGVQTGLWTQSNLWPADPSNPQKGERDIYKEVEAGVHSVKTDVAWVGAGYSMALNGIAVAYDAISSKSNMKPNIVTLDGWAGTQRYGGIWSGDQTGGQWEYIRFHIPTYIGTGLSGQPNIGSDMDGIFGGKNKAVQTRDFQWKAFTTYMLDMDGWGSNQKSPWALGEDNTSINRTYLKLKAQLMPYINKISHTATAEGGLPMIRAMFLEEANDYTLGSNTQYQYMWGDNFLVAPIYQNTAADAKGNDIRNDIYLPSTSDTWIDYFTGQQYRGGQVLNNFDAPIWKLPLFVKNGAIIPMYAENNNPEAVTSTNDDGLDRSQRIIEFYPHGSTQFETYEDDGKTLGGASSKSLITSEVKDGNATLTANKAIGSYTGMVKERSTEFVVNVSKAPTGVTGKVAGQNTDFRKVTTQAEYDAATDNVYFYNEAPSVAVKNYATEGTTYANIEDTTTPKLYVKSAAKVDITANDFTVVVAGFENSQDLGEDVLDTSLAVPAGLAETSKTDAEINVAWNAVDNAETYYIEVDGTIYRNIKDTNYAHYGLSYLTDHTYRVRTVASNGHYSNWSDLITIQTNDNPYRNVPSVKASWSHGDSWGGLNNAFDHDTGTMFHSTNAVTPDQMMTLDLGAAYQLDKLTYQPRMDNKGNGTVKRMDVYASLDGINYTKVWDGQANAPWTYSSSMEVDDIKEMKLSGLKARYLKLSVLDSVGGFFSAAEITPYKLDGTDAWVVGDVNNSGALEDGDLTFYENYVGLIPTDADWDYSALGNIDNNDLIDAYDISFVARMLGDPVNPNTATKGVDGKIQIIPSKTEIKAGDTVTLNYYGIGLKNVNAFSAEMPVDSDLFEVTNFGSASLKTVFMRNFSKTRFHSDGSIDNYVCFTNVGKQDLINGTGSLATVTIKANRDFTWETKASRAILVGQDLSIGDGVIDITQVPTTPETETIVGRDSIGDVVTSLPDGTVVAPETLWQNSGNWLANLTDGDLATNSEFKWYFKESDIPAEVTLPMDLSFELNITDPLTKVRVYNRTDKSNGCVTSIKATAYAGEVAYDLGTINEERDVFEFAIPADAKNITRVVITPLTSRGTAGGTQTGSESNRMLTLREIEFVTDTKVGATGITFDESSAKQVYVGALGQVSATVGPKNVTNPFYSVTSSDESIAKVIKIPMENEYIYAIQGIKEGTVTLTATSEDGTYETTQEFTVVAGVDTSLLVDQIAEFEALPKNLYTEASYDKAKAVIEKAKLLIDNDNAEQSDVDKITIEIVNIMKELEFKGSNDDQPSSMNLIDQAGMSRYDESSMSAAEKEDASRVIDGKKDTIWHSNYNAGYSLPQYVTIDLGDTYDLEQVDMLPRQNSRNGHISHYRIEVSTDEGDNKVFTPVVEGYLANDGSMLDDPSTAKEIKFDKVEARYVRFIAIESLGDTPNHYASIAELNFYGKNSLLSNPDKVLEKADAIYNTNISLEESKYTVTSWDEFVAARDALADLLVAADPDESIVTAATAQLVAAMDNLVIRANQSLVSQLSATVAEYSALESEYTTEEFASMKAALGEAEVILAKGTGNITRDEATAMSLKLLDEKVALNKNESTDVLLENLASQIEIANEILADEDYLANIRPSAITALRDAVTAAETLVNEVSQDRTAIKAASTALVKAANELYEIVDRTLLQELITKGEAYLDGNYSSASKEALQVAIEAAKGVDNDDATVDQIKTAVESLTTAISNLVPAADKAALQNQINITKNILDNIDNYVSSTVANLSELYEQAKLVLKDDKATQEQVNAMTQALTAANMQARVKADKKSLVDLIASINDIDLSKYEASSVAKLTNVVANANLLIENEAATQAEVDAMVTAVKDAIAGLVETGETPVVPDATVKPGSSTVKPNASTDKNTSAKTGDVTSMGASISGLVLAGLAVVATKKRKKSK